MTPSLWLLFYINSLSFLSLKSKAKTGPISFSPCCILAPWLFSTSTKLASQCCVLFRVTLFWKRWFSSLALFQDLEKTEWLQFLTKMYEESGLLFPYMQNFFQDIQQLEEYCKYQKTNVPMVICFLCFCLYLYALFTLCLSSFLLCLSEWSAFIWSVLNWVLAILKSGALVFVYFDLLFALYSNLLCLVSEKMGV